MLTYFIVQLDEKILFQKWIWLFIVHIKFVKYHEYFYYT